MPDSGLVVTRVIVTPGPLAAVVFIDSTRLPRRSDGHENAWLPGDRERDLHEKLAAATAAINLLEQQLREARQQADSNMERALAAEEKCRQLEVLVGELRAEIERLEAIIAELRAEIERLKARIAEVHAT